MQFAEQELRFYPLFTLGLFFLSLYLDSS